MPAAEMITTGRLVLRRPSLADAPAILGRYAADPDVTPFWAGLVIGSLRTRGPSCDGKRRRSSRFAFSGRRPACLDVLLVVGV